MVRVVALVCAVGCGSSSSPSDSSPIARDTDGGTTVPDGGAGGSMPLPDTAFVFVKSVRSNADHLWAFDTASNRSWEISTLGDDGQNGIKLNGPIALSPDRSLVAFIAIFRVLPDDAYTNGDAQALWTVATDGASFNRVTPPLPKPSDDGCTIQNNDPRCPMGYTCDTAINHCFPPHYQVTRLYPEFSPDGSTLWFELETSWFDETGMLVAGGLPTSVPTSGGQQPMPFMDSLPGCLDGVGTQPSISPDGQKMILNIFGCRTPGSEGLYVYGVPPSSPMTQVAALDVFSVPKVRWKDANTIVYVEKGQDAQGRAAIGVIEQAIGGQPKTISAFMNPNSGVVHSLALSSDGKQIVASFGDAGRTACDLYSITSIDSATPQLSRLTNDGTSCLPAWR
jgi:hypothetical protein